MPTRTEAIKRFLSAKTHADLANLYNYGMECQVNVAQDGGERVDSEFEGRRWHGWTDGLTTWKSFRVPWNASTVPEYDDKEMSFDLVAHAEAIGMTGWDWQSKVSRWVAYDFDAIIGHSDKHANKLTNEELEEVKKAAYGIEWITIRKSTSGTGIHLYVYLPSHIKTNNHHEHAALARAILGKMSALTGFDFHSKIDACGGNMWVWHRKMGGTDGLTLIKEGKVLDEVPPNWKDHIKVVSGKRRKNLPQNIEASGRGDLFEELAGQRPKTPLEEDHKTLITYLQENNALWWWDQDHHMLVTHSYWLQKAHEDLQLKGVFKTNSKGSNLNEQNCFCYPLRRGAWVIRRFTPGVQEDDSWDQDGAGWTRCYLNKEPNLATAARTFGGLEDPSGGFIFREAEVAEKASALLGVHLKVGNSLRSRETKLKQHKDGRLVVTVERKEMDRADDMQGWLAKKKDWIKIFNTQLGTPEEPESGNYDDLVRHLVTETNEDYGWMIKSDTDWRSEPLSHVRVALGSLGLKHTEITTILGSSVFKCWRVVNKPFQPEYPGDREWNRNAAQLRFLPSENKEKLNYPTWMKILDHCGQGLNEAIRNSAWCQANGILTGGDYLKCWVASLFQEPEEPLPYLFMYGPQNSGKSIFHESLNLLFTKGYKRADAALINASGFNGELEGAITCVVEETDLRRDRQAYNRIKDWVTSRELLIHCKGKTPYHIPNTTHWIHCLPKNAWILTSEGPRQLADLINKPVTVIVNGQKYNTKGFFKTGVRDIYTVTTSSGRILEATADHLVKCSFDGLKYWKEVGKLSDNDRLCLNNHVNASWHCDDSTFEDGYLLGWLLGDGTIFKRQHKKEQVVKIYIYPDDHSQLQLLEECFGNNDFSITLRKDGAYCLTSKYLYSLVRNYNIEKRKITKNIQEASVEFQSGLISGLFDTDGTATLERHTIALYQSDLGILRSIQQILLNIGINSHIYLARPSRTLRVHKNKKDTVSKPSYQLVIRKRSNLKLFYERIGFSNPRKQKLLKQILNSWTRKAIEEDYTDKVSTVVYSRTEDVYDITVPSVHCFDANGFIVHNCSNDHQACPVFSGDTRITMCYVDMLEPMELIPKKQIIPMLEKEAPDFLAAVLQLEIPPSNDRLNVPVIATEDKHLAQELNQTDLERFLSEKCMFATGHQILFAELYDKFLEWLDPNEIHKWSKIRVGRSFPPQYPKGKARKDGQIYVGNITWSGVEVSREPRPKLTIKDGYLVPVE